MQKSGQGAKERDCKGKTSGGRPDFCTRFILAPRWLSLCPPQAERQVKITFKCPLKWLNNIIGRTSEKSLLIITKCFMLCL